VERTQDGPADAPKPVNGDPNGHGVSPFRFSRHSLYFAMFGVK
jgi:hypothetical protein